MTLPTITQDRIDLSAGDEIILRFRDWRDYESLLERRQENAGLRIRYDSTTQEIRVMSPLPGHGKNADMIADFVKAMLRKQGKEWEAFTPITLKRLYRQGIEPDYCFYIQNRDAILGHERIDLETDPPPDLAIEIDLTSTTRPEDYQSIAIGELWIYRRKELLIFFFDGQAYQETQRSLLFPHFDIKGWIPTFIDRGWQAGSSVAIREFEQRLGNSP
ncbi:MAG: Uma2 family endonuclease [Thermosynechococcaceae cyanobacterium]